MPGKTDTNSTPADTNRFATTHWSVVLAARSPESTRYHEALEMLCRTYWFPLYAFLRRRGYDKHQAEDYIQGFFANLLEKRGLRLVDPKCGKFRSFMLVALKHFLADQRGRELAQKRGGGWKALSLDFENAESQYALELAHNLTPEKLFEKFWAMTVLERTMAQLKAESASAGKQKLFDHLKICLLGVGDSVSYHQMGAELGMTEGAVKVAVHRLRKRYRELLRHEIIQTVASADEADEEIQNLFAALAQ
ncbi:RNA polymerase sigma factor [Planctomycetota bacterium]